MNPSPSNPGASSYFNFLSKDVQFDLRKKKFDYSRAERAVEEAKKNKPKQPIETNESADGPAAKKFCLETCGPLTDEDVIALKASEKKKVKYFTLIDLQSHPILILFNLTIF